MTIEESSIIAVKILKEDGSELVEPPDNTICMDREFVEQNPDIANRIVEPNGCPGPGQTFSGKDLKEFLVVFYEKLDEHYRKKTTGLTITKIHEQVKKGYRTMALTGKDPDEPFLICICNVTAFFNINNKLRDKETYLIEKEGEKERLPGKKVKTKKQKRK